MSRYCTGHGCHGNILPQIRRCRTELTWVGYIFSVLSKSLINFCSASCSKIDCEFVLCLFVFCLSILILPGICAVSSVIFFYEFSMILRCEAGVEAVARLNRSNSLIKQGHGSSVMR